jgi:hypothetical protein
MGFVTVPSMPHVLVLFNLSDCIVFLVGKVVDDVTIARNGHFVEFLGSSFGSGRSLEMVCAELPVLSRAVPQDGDELNGMENFKRYTNQYKNLLLSASSRGPKARSHIRVSPLVNI